VCCQHNTARALSKTSEKPIPSIKKTGDFKRVFNKGRCVAGHMFVMYAAENEKNMLRLGISVSKKVGSAVVRSRVKRLVRECMRILAGSGGFCRDLSYDLVVVARPLAGGLVEKSVFLSVKNQIEKLLRKHGFLA